MAEKRIRQNEISEATGLHKSNISRMLNGRANISESVIRFFKEKYGATFVRSDTQNITEIAQPVRNIDDLLSQVDKLESELRWAKQLIESQNKNIQFLESQLDQQRKKRDPRYEDGGSTIPTGGNK